MEEGHRQFGNEYVGLCHATDVRRPTPGIELQAVGHGDAEWTVPGMGLMIARYFVRARRRLHDDRFDIVHHMFPWGFRVAFNPLATLGHTEAIPFVIGPIQAPQVYLDYTEYQHRALLDADQAQAQRHVEVGTAPFLHRLLSPVQEDSLLAADALVFDGSTTEDLYRVAFPSIESVPRFVIPAGVETETFAPRIEFSERPPEIMTAGYFTRRKGLEFLVSALPSVLEAHPDIRLRVCGGGPALPGAMRLASDLGISECVIFQGLVLRSQLPEYYSRARLYVQPSLSEAYPSAVLEALACGTPVVASRVGVLPDHFEGNGAVQLTTPGDVHTLAEAIVHSLETDGTARSRVARETAEGTLSWRHTALEWQKVYRRVTG